MLKLWIQSRVDLHINSTRSYLKTALQQQAHPVFHQPSKGFGFFKAWTQLIQQSPPIWWRQIPGCLCWIWLNWSSSCKNRIYTIQCFLQQQVRFSHFESKLPDKQSVVYTKQSVVSISRSRNMFDFRDFSKFKQFQRKIHKNQSILPLFVFTNRL